MVGAQDGILELDTGKEVLVALMENSGTFQGEGFRLETFAYVTAHRFHETPTEDGYHSGMLHMWCVKRLLEAFPF